MTECVMGNNSNKCFDNSVLQQRMCPPRCQMDEGHIQKDCISLSQQTSSHFSPFSLTKKFPFCQFVVHPVFLVSTF